MYDLSDSAALSLMASPCHYCGQPPSNVASHPDFNGVFVYSGIDRVDNGKGYCIGNVVPCCRHCNYAKRDRALGDFYEWIARVHGRAQGKGLL